MSDSDTTDSSAAKDKAFLKSRKSLYNKRQYVKKCNITQGPGLVEQESKRLKSASSSGIIPIEANTSIGNIPTESFHDILAIFNLENTSNEK